MIHPLPNPDVEAERVMLIPAGNALSFRDEQSMSVAVGRLDWYGKRRPNLVPLTREWAISAMQPKPQPDGSTLYTLTPPRPSGWSAGWVLAGLAFIVLLGAIFTYPLWR